jgi:hypothetical protein
MNLHKNVFGNLINSAGKLEEGKHSLDQGADMNIISDQDEKSYSKFV